MNQTVQLAPAFNWHNLYRLFKYAVYLLLTFNIYLFFVDDNGASVHFFKNGISWRNIVEAYSATIDTASWVFLLLLFELETAIIPDHRITPSVNFFLKLIKTICYLFIIYACYGYFNMYGFVTNVVPFSMGTVSLGALSMDNVCSLLGQDYYSILTMSEYPELTGETCAALQGQPLLRIDGTNIIGTHEQLNDIKLLALVDVINAVDWLFIVVILEVEVWLQLHNKLTDKLLFLNKFVKFVLYGVLLAAATYWGFEGDFLDFWDAFLWLVAFIFIEMNIFEWHEEVEEEKLKHVVS